MKLQPIAILVLIGVNTVLAARSCPKDEEYQTVGYCSMPVCPKTKPTSRPAGPARRKYIRPCPAVAIFGCFCRRGLYRRKSDKRCVPMDQCWST